MGKILRVGVDTTINYTLSTTSAYDSNNPAGTAVPYATPEDLDQAFNVAVPPNQEFTAQGFLVTFARFPEFTEGVKVKVRPTYDFAAGENPFLEVWTHDSVANEWTLRIKRQLSSLFVGVESGQLKIFDFVNTSGFAVALENLDKVWVTMNPGTTGTPTMTFVALQLYGRCNPTIVTPGSCEDIETVDCIDPNGGGTDPGLDPSDGGPIPPTQPPDFPAIDLCDEAELQAFKAQLTPEQLTYFEELLEASELPCLPVPQILPINEDPNGDPILPHQPIEIYVDPNTLQPAVDPRNPDQGPGDNPDSDDDRLRKTYRFVLSWSGNDEGDSLAAVTANVPEPPGASGLTTEYGNWGPDAGTSTDGVMFTPAPYGIRLKFGSGDPETGGLDGLPPACLIGVRVRSLRLRGPVVVNDSVSDAGIHITPAFGLGVPGPDWILTPTETLQEDDPSFVGDSYMVWRHLSTAFRTDAQIVFELPRENPAQNDAATPAPTDSPRSVFGFQRGGCILGFTVKTRSRWLFDVSGEDFDTSTAVHNPQLEGVRPYVFVIDVTLRSIFVGMQFGIGSVAVGLDVNDLSDAEPIESCV